MNVVRVVSNIPFCGTSRSCIFVFGRRVRSIFRISTQHEICGGRRVRHSLCSGNLRTAEYSTARSNPLKPLQEASNNQHREAACFVDARQYLQKKQHNPYCLFCFSSVPDTQSPAMDNLLWRPFLYLKNSALELFNSIIITPQHFG